ncbi:hypothetical protein Pd630_LPD14009 (plasmid) [Rhodococcus opacus PD630]|nr:hypothetical protein Pd630_LPD14009 [Rhodococcus opacus PD630]
MHAASSLLVGPCTGPILERPPATPSATFRLRAVVDRTP